MKEVPFVAQPTTWEGKPRTAFVIPCSSCGDQLTIVRPLHVQHSRRVALENKLVSTSLDNAGWTYKTGFRRCECPKCNIKPIEETKEMPAPASAAITQTTPVATAVAEPPRQPTLVQRRAVLEALDMAYNTTKGCYSKGFSDDKLAKSLNFPRKWVSDIREQFFGISEKSEDYAETVQAISNLRTQITAVEESIFKEFQKLDAFKAQLDKLAASLK
ncbi:hypothetical protein EVC24_040 [Rhizobium phage RHph_I4]|nr:hypothetical protein EVC24_040 [Rhizobium phage RHph_I4]